MTLAFDPERRLAILHTPEGQRPQQHVNSVGTAGKFGPDAKVFASEAEALPWSGLS